MGSAGHPIPDGGEGVAGDQAGPDQVPQGRDVVVSVAERRPRPGSRRVEEVGAPGGEGAEQLPGPVPLDLAAGRTGIHVGGEPADPAVVVADRAVADPEHLTAGGQFVQHGRGVVGDPGRQDRPTPRALAGIG